MISTRPENASQLISLKEAAKMLDVTVDMLLDWNDNNILKPTITLNGEIGYTREQINKFLAIQELTLSKKLNYEKPKVWLQNQTLPIKSAQDGMPSGSYQEKINISTNTNLYSNNTGPIDPRYEVIKSSKTLSSNLRYFGIISSFSIVTISLIALFVTQQNNIMPLLSFTSLISKQETNNMEETVSKSPLIGMKFLEPTTPVLQVPLKNKSTSSANNLNDSDITGTENKLAMTYPIFAGESLKNSEETRDQLPFVPILGRYTEADTQTDNTDAVSVDYNTIAHFASRPNTPSGSKNEENLFDDNGNIKGEATDPGLLATALGTTGIVKNDVPLSPALDLNIMLAFLSLGLLSVLFVYKRQPAYSIANLDANPLTSPNFDNDPLQQRVLEIGQKTDGTVVLYFQGKECKVSKPELFSESDQFIERLLGFAGQDVKEINYDIQRDDKIQLNAPLSKLVTRLGFVGLKRDLFFPRTSKNNVLFRRYLTGQDLSSMGLTVEKISRELIN